MYKVFIQNRPLHFISEGDFLNKEGISISEKVALSNQKHVYQLINQTPTSISVYIISENPFASMTAFFKDHESIEAAGGIVKKGNEYLFIFKNEYWDLPKGIIDAGESPKITAKREVEEECGIEDPEINDLITTTYHTYEYEGNPVLKKTYWYAFTYDGNQELIPQREEGITEVAWKDKVGIEEIITDTYLSIQEVVSIYFYP